MNKVGTIERLRVDHKLIVAFLAQFEAYLRRIDQGAQPDMHPQELLDFVEGFIERFHHRREELVLFDHLMRRSPSDRVMARRLVHDHDDARHHVEGMKSVIDMRSPERRTAFVWNGLGYAQMVLEHIGREERETYPMAAGIIDPQDEALLAERFDRVSPDESECWAAARSLLMRLDDGQERATGA